MDVFGEIDVDELLEEKSEDTSSVYLNAIRQILAPQYAELSDDDVEKLMSDITAGMSCEELEGFLNTLGKLAKKIAPVARTLAPIAGTAVGAYFGGPAGMAIGGALGRTAGQMITTTGKKPVGKTPAVSPAVIPQPATIPTPPAGQSAVNQLMLFLQNPAFLQSLLAQILGSFGRSTVNVGAQGTSAPFGAFMNALSHIVKKVGKESIDRMQASQLEEIPGYLMDAEGNVLCDPASPEQRAELLLQKISEEAPVEMPPLAQTDESATDDLTEWFLEAGMLEEYSIESSPFPESDAYPSLSMDELLRHVQIMKNRIATEVDSNPKRRLVCLFDGIITGRTTDFRYYTAHWVRKIFNYGYAPGQTQAALSDLKRDLEFIIHYSYHTSRSAIRYIRGIDTSIHNGIAEIHKLYNLWGDADRNIREMHAFVYNGQRNPQSVYYCYGEGHP